MPAAVKCVEMRCTRPKCLKDSHRVQGKKGAVASHGAHSGPEARASITYPTGFFAMEEMW